MTLVKESETLNLKSLFQKYWDRQMLVSPSYATFCGINDYNDRLEDLSVESGKQHLSWLTDLRDQMLSIPDDQVDADDLLAVSAIPAVSTLSFLVVIRSNLFWIILIVPLVHGIAPVRHLSFVSVQRRSRFRARFAANASKLLRSCFFLSKRN